MPLTAVHVAPAPTTAAAPPSVVLGESGEPVTFEWIFQEYAAFVWRALRRLSVPEGDIEDVCQEVFLVVHRRLSTFAGRSSVKTWVYGICIRTASDHRRRRQNRREEISASPPEGTVPASQDDDLDRRRTLARLDTALDQLDEDKRAVFVLYEFEKLSMAEIAEAVGCPAQTAYARLYAARRTIEAALLEAPPSRRTP